VLTINYGGIFMKWGLSHRPYDSNTGLDLFRKDVNNLFNDFFSFHPTSLFENEWLPSVDVKEKDHAISIIADIPGLSEKEIEVTIEKNVLTISGEKKEEKKEENKDQRYILSERRFGSFRRSIHLPGNIIQDQIKAEYKNGVLNIEIPKDVDVNAKKIEIKAN
jgi:HSP20 family protein